MKKLLMIIVLFSFNSDLNAQNYGLPKNFNYETNQLEYEEVVTLDSEYSKDILYEKLKRWVVNGYKYYDGVVQLEDKEAGNIIVKGVIPFKFNIFGAKAFIDHILDIRVKDGRYKYKLSANYIYSYDFGNNPYSRKDFYFNKLKSQNHVRHKWIKTSDEKLQLLIMEMKNFVDIELIEEDW